MNVTATIHALAQVHLPQGRPAPQLNSWKPLLIATVLCFTLALALIAAAILLSRPRRTPTAPQAKHVPMAAKDQWKARIRQVVSEHAQGQLNQSQAMGQLAEIVRAFASEASGQDLTAQTLAELSRQPRTPTNKRRLDLLRQTIAALYPPEFADPDVNRQAFEADVGQAAGWAEALIERWR
ncbi:hypothetical protein [Bifidobacterium xylocopae]|uniref:DUF4381 domain-containing protein n=1 Tax=Bifidobacterium xylocopae TaxID=2493119 RepID=A0A366KE19_9BIFI|nr:hypothetical protein [Bifidobacterium xylocopae]RBP99944.1 hypothetical protein CRD59_00265 [Bifidobacterium xylocopae]